MGIANYSTRIGGMGWIVGKVRYFTINVRMNTVIETKKVEYVNLSQILESMGYTFPAINEVAREICDVWSYGDTDITLVGNNIFLARLTEVLSGVNIDLFWDKVPDQAYIALDI